MVGTDRTPPLPYRVRPPQVLLGVGAVLLVSAGAAVASAHGGIPARVLLLVLAGVAAGFSLRAARGRLRSSEETLAAAAAGLALAASSAGALSLDGEPVSAAAFAVVFLVLHQYSRTTLVWPVAAWMATQLAVLRLVDDTPPALRLHVFLAVALLGLGIALFGRPVIARIALVTTAPWWIAGLVSGVDAAWTDAGVRP